ncbi:MULTISPECIES: glutathione transferase GstA [Pseudomonas]|uniref:glutathione transferase GstA n=1 Tax=Pseudomonas TaxID=286 RepID=UPI000736080F|nr:MULTISPECIES: glutathione transferase GstA [Pseudomonas]KTB76869.1 glutathione S-transferase [Pseudomonas syringae pv. syringae PD2774]MCA5975056.1 glutathione transferase GstA [Pseudomonas sp. P135]MCH5537577.1 glutathione transferase GstA [Pseudomonas syringae pv. syringae]MCH5573148.1 glutathione transferase GstA [Pseudomonas syringae pv. syringae]
MKFYYSPGSCSLAAHIVLHEAGVAHELVKVNLRQHTLESGDDYYAINPKGAVPALGLDGGAVLTEGAAVLQYLGDHFVPALVPANGTLERARLQEILNYLAAEYHKAWTPLFYLAKGADATDAQRPVIARQTYLNGLLADGRDYLLGNDFSVADTYLFAVTRWSVNFGISLEAQPALQAFMARVEARPSVKAVLKAEGLPELFNKA